MSDEDGHPKYSCLTNLALAILLLVHGNSDPEHRFCMNQNFLEKYKTNVAEDTLESIRMIKNILIQSGGHPVIN